MRGRSGSERRSRHRERGDEDRKQRKLKGLSEGEEDDDNAAYLDSLGWVLFKQKKYKEALPPLEEAVKDTEGQHIEIFDHLGDVQMALGNRTAAVDAWKKGLEFVGTSKREQERKVTVEKKLKEQEKK